MPTPAGDYGRLEEVLLKLLQNAVQFTPAGGQVAVTVRRASATEAAKLNQRQSKASPGPGVACVAGPPPGLEVPGERGGECLVG